MLTTARAIINLALKEAGPLGVGQTALAEDMNDSFTLLQRMMAQWQKKRWLVPALEDVSKVGNSLKSNTVGTGGYWNIVRPNDVKAAYVIQLNTGSTPVSLGCDKIFSYEDYIRIAVKDLNTLPTHFFYDGHFPLGNLFFWPIPSSMYELHILVPMQLGFPTNLDSVFALPDEYLEAIHYNLALRLCSAYQIEPQKETKLLARSALNTIKNVNTQVPTLVMPSGLKRERSFNIYNADGH